MTRSILIVCLPSFSCSSILDWSELQTTIQPLSPVYQSSPNTRSASHLSPPCVTCSTDTHWNRMSIACNPLASQGQLLSGFHWRAGARGLRRRREGTLVEQHVTPGCDHKEPGTDAHRLGEPRAAHTVPRVPWPALTAWQARGAARARSGPGACAEIAERPSPGSA